MDELSVRTAKNRGRGRRPAGEVRAEVLDATMRLLLDEGVRAVTFDRVAGAAGASKTTLYKWWETPGALMGEAYFAANEVILEFPDTGDIAADIRAQLRAFIALLTSGEYGRVIAELIAVSQWDTSLRAALSKAYTRPRRELAKQAFERASSRGQLRSGTDADVLVDQLWGACYNRLLVPDEGLNAEFADALVHNLLLGCATEQYRSELEMR